MLCKNCGAQLPDEVEFCPDCGASQHTSTEQPIISSEMTPPDSPAPVATLECAPKKRKTGLIVSLAAVLAVAVLIAGLLLGKSLFNGTDTDEDTEPSASSTVPSSSQLTSQPAPEKVELVISPAKLTFEMTDADVTKFYELLDQCKTAALNGQSGDDVMKISDALDDQYEYMDSQLSIAMVLYYCDLQDESASQRYLDCTEQVTQANNDYLEMAKVLYDSDFPAKERFFEEWTDLDLAMLNAYTPEVMALRQRNSEITVAYQDLQNDPDMYTKMVPLYIEMVQNNNRMAHIFGYANYYEYAYDLVYDRDYGQDQVATMRTLVGTYMPQTIDTLMDDLVAEIGQLSNNQQMKLSAFMQNAFTDTYVDEIEGYLATLPQQARDAMLDMFDGNILLMSNMDNGQEGAFTTSVGQDRYVCFFGPGYSSPMTAIHEVGHYYGCQYTDLNDLPLDLAETQSQGNEWLFMSYLENEMGKTLYNVAVDYTLYESLCTIMISVIVDEFEQQVYTHPDIAGLTSDKLDAIMADVCKNYGGIDFISSVAADIQQYWRLVVVEQPVYYISYGVSAISAINIFTIADEDYQEAVDIYCSLIESVDLEEGFLGNIQDAGLDGPFDDEVYLKLQAMCG